MIRIDRRSRPDLARQLAALELLLKAPSTTTAPEPVIERGETVVEHQAERVGSHDASA